MSTNIERNIVEMRFDNKKFEKNVKQSMDSIDQFKKSLKFEDSEKSFKKLEENAKKVDLSPLSKGIDKVRASFSFLDTFSATVYHRISNRLIDIGKKVASSVSTDGIKGGFREYELKMNSFKTIRNATIGKNTDEDINKELERLNKYADDTIYKFSDMTDNIGKFVNAGVDLHKATDAIMGVSNAAALAGASSQQASMAMYNISQALGSGHMLAMDWRSIENAMMATVEFKQALVDVAVEEKTLIKQTNGLYKAAGGNQTFDPMGDFRGTLSQKWLTSDVLVKALAKYNDMTTDLGKRAHKAATEVSTFTKMIDALKEAIESGWGQTWELVIGNLKEATDLYTKINDKISAFIGNFFDERKEILKNWKAHGGRTKALEALGEIMKNLGSIFRTVGEAWHSLFPKKDHNSLLRATDALAEFAKKTKPAEETLKTLKQTFRGLFAAFDIVRIAFSSFRKTIGVFFIKVLKDALHQLFGVTGGLGDMLVKVRQSIKENQTFTKVFGAIVTVLDGVYTVVKKVASALWKFAGIIKDVATESGGVTVIADWLKGLGSAIKNFDISAIGNSIKKLFVGIWKFIDRVLSKTFSFYTPMKQKLNEIKETIKQSKVAQWVVGVFEKMRNGVQKVIDSFKSIKTDGVKDMTDNVKSEVTVFDKIAGFFKKVWGVIKSIADVVWPVMKTIFTSIGTGIKMLWSGITENIKNSDMGDAGGLVAGAGIFAFLMSAKKFIDNMKPLFTGLKKLGDGKFLKNIFDILAQATLLIKANILKQIATSILILVGAIFVLCTLPKEKVALATITVMTLFKGISDTFNAYDKSASNLKATTMLGMAGQLLGLAVAMGIMTIAIRSIAKLDYEASTKALIIIGAMLQMMQVTITKMIGLKKMSGGSLSITLNGVSKTISAVAKALLMMIIAVFAMVKMINAYSFNTVGSAVVLVAGLFAVITSGIALILKFTKETNKEAKTGEKLLKTIGLLAGIALLIAAFSKLIIGITAAIALLAVALSHGVISGGSLIGAIGAMAAIVLTIIGAIWLIQKVVKDANPKDILAAAGMLTVVTVFMTSITTLLMALAILPRTWSEEAVVALTGIAFSLSMIMTSLAFMMSQVKKGGKLDPKTFSTIMGTVVITIMSMTAALILMSHAASGSGFNKAIIALGVISAALVGFIALAGKSSTFAKGLQVITASIRDIGIGLAAFAGAALMVIEIFDKISRMTSWQIDKFAGNIEHFLNVLKVNMDRIALLLSSLVMSLVSSVIQAAAYAVVQSGNDIAKALIDILDMLLAQAPVIMQKLLLLAAEILSGIERGLVPIVDIALRTAVKFVNALADSIRNHKDEILNAIDNIFDAAAGLVASAVGRVIGIKHWEAGYRTLKTIIDRFGKLILTIFAIKKLTKTAGQATSIVSKFVLKLKSLTSDIKAVGFKDAWKEFFGIDKLNLQMREISAARELGTREITGLGAFVERMGVVGKAAGIGAAIGTIIATPIKAIIDSVTDSMDATKTLYASVNADFAEMEAGIESTTTRLRDVYKDSRDKIAEVDKKYDTGGDLLERLNKLVDPKTNKIKEGKENEVKELVKRINSELGIQLTLESSKLYYLDEQGKKLEYQYEQIKKIIATERLRDQLEAKREEVEKLKTDELPGAKEQRDKAKAEKDEIEKTAGHIQRDWEELYNLSSDLTSKKLNSEEYKTTAEQLRTAIDVFKQNYGDILDYVPKSINDAGAILERGKENIQQDKELANMIADATSSYNTAERNYNNIVETIQDYEYAEQALYSGSTERIREASLALSGYIERTGSTAQIQAHADEIKDDIDHLLENTDEIIGSELSAKIDAWTVEMKKIRQAYGFQDLSDEDKKYLEKAKGVLSDYYEKQGITMPDSSTKSTAKEDTKSGGWKPKGLADMSDKLGKSLIPSGKDATSGFTKSLTTTLEEQMPGVANKYKNETVGDINTEFDSHSPSRVMRDEVGYWVGAGIIQGMNNAINEYKPKETIQPLINMLQSSILPAMSMLTNGSAMSLPISPVFDGVNQNGTQNSIENIPAHSFAMQATYQSSLDAINSSLNLINTTLIDQTNGIIDEVRALRSDVGTLGDRIEDLDILLDGEALVGELTPRMSGSLVRYSKRVERGI